MHAIELPPLFSDSLLCIPIGVGGPLSTQSNTFPFAVYFGLGQVWCPLEWCFDGGVDRTQDTASPLPLQFLVTISDGHWSFFIL